MHTENLQELYIYCRKEKKLRMKSFLNSCLHGDLNDELSLLAKEEEEKKKLAVNQSS